jgi:hypothetical protein
MRSYSLCMPMVIYLTHIDYTNTIYVGLVYKS